MARHSVALVQLARGVLAGRVLDQLRTALPDADLRADEPSRRVEIDLEADDREHAVRRVWTALAAAGADDHFLVADHPDARMSTTSSAQPHESVKPLPP